MRSLLLTLAAIVIMFDALSQIKTQVVGDSVYIKSNSATSELILENSTKNINGFLYNRGNGRTEFRKGVIKLNDSTYIIGFDTLRMPNLQGGMAPGGLWSLSGNTAISGSDFLGTNDNQDLVVKSNGTESFRVRGADQIPVFSKPLMSTSGFSFIDLNATVFATPNRLRIGFGSEGTGNGSLDMFSSSIAFLANGNRYATINGYDAKWAIPTKIGDDPTPSGSPHPSAILELRNSYRGFLPTRLSTAQRDAIATPASGLQLYNTTTNKYNYYNGLSWVEMGGQKTLYTGDDTLTSTRNVFLDGTSLSFNYGGTENNWWNNSYTWFGIWDSLQDGDGQPWFDTYNQNAAGQNSGFWTNPLSTGWFAYLDRDGGTDSSMYVDFRGNNFEFGLGANTNWKIKGLKRVTTPTHFITYDSITNQAAYSTFNFQGGTTTPTLQQVLDAGNILNAQKSINVGTNSLTIDGNVSDVTINGPNSPLNVIPYRSEILNKNKSKTYLGEGGSILLFVQDSVWNGSNYSSAATTGFGQGALKYNIGVHSSAFGHLAMNNNSAMQSSGFGFQALMNNSGGDAAGFGLLSLANNTASFSSGFGNFSLWNNRGSFSSGFGYNALQNNQGLSSSGFGAQTLHDNIGSGATGFGGSTLHRNNWNYRIAIGLSAGTSFEPGLVKAFTSNEISSKNITIPLHGFGPAGSMINLKFNTLSGTPPGGLLDEVVYFVNIIDANTLYISTINSAGDGSFELIKDVDKSNSIVIGNSVDNTKANQVVLGQSSITETVLRGNVLVGTEAVYPSAKLAVESTTQGVLLPRMSKTQRNAIANPAVGLVIYQTDNIPGLRMYNGSAWVRFSETVD